MSETLCAANVVAPSPTKADYSTPVINIPSDLNHHYITLYGKLKALQASEQMVYRWRAAKYGPEVAASSLWRFTPSPARERWEEQERLVMESINNPISDTDDDTSGQSPSASVGSLSRRARQMSNDSSITEAESHQGYSPSAAVKGPKGIIKNNDSDTDKLSRKRKRAHGTQDEMHEHARKHTKISKSSPCRKMISPKYLITPPADDAAMAFQSDIDIAPSLAHAKAKDRKLAVQPVAIGCWSTRLRPRTRPNVGPGRRG